MVLRPSPLGPPRYFDGSLYVSANREPSTAQHPAMDDFVQDFLAAENAKIKAHNAAIAEQKV